MRHLIKYIYFSAACILLLACKEETPTVLNEGGDAPGVVSDVVVENRNGGAKLSYLLPVADNLLYVKAVYEYPSGNVREVKASAYVDSLVIEGIGDTDELEVSLYAISRSEKASSAVKVSIQPMTPPVQLVSSSLNVSADFGGFVVDFMNQSGAEIVIEVMKNTGGDWTSLDAYYTKSKHGVFTVRGQDAEPSQFGFFVRDKWKNKSDTVLVGLTPLYEIELPAPTPITILPSDYNLHFSNLHYGYMFDGIVSDNNYMGTLAAEAAIFPLSFTLDFGTPTKFSRFVYWMRQGDGHIYNYCSPEDWEIWGTNELTDDWAGWTKIMDCKAVKPSGPGATLTAEDREVAAKGLDYSFPPGTPEYRYIRWRTKKVFGGLPAVQISELAFFGGNNEMGGNND
ncbi:MAG TPA: DUF5000 domain-containing lipoprotein [Parapedobacter sp.]|uniref:DUF5000 domain-containing lipoprotein n=1 Tax=Parapedobacter sp. TaxID=1958893 RepID=UPI002BA8BD7F|nr:DUF5000 domain-containing lipoprotein [Parapedobacter sp.]HWK57096.1 DUF5000 domain-containing lipoprotein [Parapedobacter sp.]